MMYSAELQKSARVDGQYTKIVDALDKCVFCDLRAKYIIDEVDGIVLAVNLFPYINCQLIIIPRRHVEKLYGLTAAEWMALKTLIEKALQLLKDVYGVRNVHVVYREGDEQSGKSVRHLHVNLIPFTADLFKWNYQAITEEPLAVAEKLRTVDVRYVED